MITNLCNEFIEFAKEKYGVNIKAESSGIPDTFEKIFGCIVPENKLIIPFGEYKIVAEIDDSNKPEIPPEMVVYIADKNNCVVQDICVVRQHYHIAHKTMDFVVYNDVIDCLVWADSDDEDYTHKHVIGIYEEEEK